MSAYPKHTPVLLLYYVSLMTLASQAVSFYASATLVPTAGIYHFMPLGTCQGNIILIVKFNKEIGRLRILNKAQSPKYSKQVVFDTVKILQIQKSVISIGSDCVFDRVVSLGPLKFNFGYLS